jgi:superfamily II DNA or RNA helicase
LDNKEVFFINGEMPVSERQEIISRMEVCNDIVCIAMSAIFSTGINIKNLPYIMFASGGKSFIRTIQSIGRGLRLHDDKEQLVLFDITDNMKYSTNHLAERKKFYDEECLPWKEIELTIL